MRLSFSFSLLHRQVMEALIMLSLSYRPMFQKHIQHLFLLQVQLMVLLLMRQLNPVIAGKRVT